MSKNKIKLLVLTENKFGKAEAFNLSKSKNYVITSFNKNSLDISGLYKNKYDLIIFYSNLFSETELNILKKIRNVFTNKFPLIYIQKENIELSDDYFENTNTAFFNSDYFSNEILKQFINLFYNNYVTTKKIDYETTFSELFFSLSENSEKKNYHKIISSIVKSKLFNSAVIIVSKNDVYETHQNIRIFDIKNISEQISEISFLKNFLDTERYGDFGYEKIQKVFSFTKNGARFFVENLYYSVHKINDTFIYLLATSEFEFQNDFWVKRIFLFLEQKFKADYKDNNLVKFDENKFSFDELLEKTSLKFATFLIHFEQKKPDVVHLSANFEHLTGIDKKNLHNVEKWGTYFLKQNESYFDLSSNDSFLNSDVFEQEIRSKNKSTNFWLKLLTYKYVNYSNQLVILGTFIDVTDYKIIELELIAKKNQALIQSEDKSAFLAKISYDIRTAMNSVLGFSSILSSANLNEKKRKKYGDIVKKSGNSILKILDDILIISLIESKKITHEYDICNLNYFIKGIEIEFKKTIENDNKIDIITIIPENTNDLVLYTDIKKLQKIFEVLVENAIKYTVEGTVTIGYNLEEDKNTITFFVKDTGIGLTYEQKDNIFKQNRYYNDLNNEHPSGLSLHIVKGYVTFLKGEIWVESDLMEGSDFYFTLPLNVTLKKDSTLSELNKVAEHQTDEVDFSKLKIVIAEDDPMSAEYLKEILLDANANVELVGNGEELMILLDKYVPDLILLDLKMPKKNGIECLSEIKRKGINTKIIVQSAFNSPDDQKKVIEMGADAYISKPIDHEKLFNIINNLSFK